MKKLLFVFPLLLSACSVMSFSAEKLSPSCQTYFKYIDNSVAQSTLPESELTVMKASFANSRNQLSKISVEQQERICSARLAQLAKY
ncbi:MAG: DUF5339 family protein [[Pasteurella] mairii]|uniref:Lipoprotein n=1 Tax=[Pasteurella] mairii TaxID=757 RepID=A0A379B2C4_9PAST|nr:DUF5339 family protein [[Pasteurella] mairii]SUB32774.1 Uncharacterised protein [[Pasteurella] mairii]